MLLYEFFSAVVCTVVSSAALGYCYSFSLIEGDRMYLNVLGSQSIPVTDTLSLIYLPNQDRSTVQSPAIEVTEQNESPVEVTKSPSEAKNSRQSPIEANIVANSYYIRVYTLSFPCYH